MRHARAGGPMADIARSSRQRVAAIVAAVAVIVVALAVVAAIAVVPSDSSCRTSSTSAAARRPRGPGGPRSCSPAIGILAFGEGYLAGVWVVSSLIAWTPAAGSVVVYLAARAAGQGVRRQVRVRLRRRRDRARRRSPPSRSSVARSARPRRAQPRIWDSLRDRHSQLWARIRGAREGPPLEDSGSRAQNATMLAEAQARFTEHRAELARRVTISRPPSGGRSRPAIPACFGRCTGSRR